MIIRWLFDDYLMTFRWLSDDYTMTIQWLSNDYPMTIQWLFNDYPMTIQWLCNDYRECLIYFSLWSLIYRPKMIVLSPVLHSFLHVLVLSISSWTTWNKWIMVKHLSLEIYLRLKTEMSSLFSISYSKFCHFVWNTSDMVTVMSPKMTCMAMIMMRTRKRCCKISSHLVRETLAETFHGRSS